MKLLRIACETRPLPEFLPEALRGLLHGRLRGLVPVLSGALLLALGCDRPPREVRVLEPGGAVAAGTPAATRVGIDILARGGNAADAAVAVSLALAVTEPGQSGLGGHGVALIVEPDGAATVLHAPVLPISTAGTGDAALPALTPVLERLWRRHGSGRLSWEELVEPARALAADGFRLTRYSHRTLVREYPRLLADPIARRRFLVEGGALPPEGTRMTRPDLAATLERLAAQGPAELQRGQVANRLVEWTRDQGVEIQAAHLRRVTPVEAAPLRTDFGGWTVLGPGEPFPGDLLVDALERLRRAPEEGGGAGGLGGSGGEGGKGGVVALAEALAQAYGLPSTGEDGRRAPTAPAGGAGTHFSIVDGSGGAVSMAQSLGRPYGSGTVAGRLGFFLGSTRDAPTSTPASAATSTTMSEAGPTAGGEGGAIPGDIDPRGADTRGADTREIDTREVDTREIDAPDVRGSGVDTDARIAADRVPGAAALPLPVVALSPEGGLLVLGSAGGPPGTSAVVQVLVAILAEPGASLTEAIARPRLHPGSGSGSLRLYLEGPPWVVVPPAAGPAPDGAARDGRPGAELTAEGEATSTPWSPDVRRELEARGLHPVQLDGGLLFEGLSPWFGGVNAVLLQEGRWAAVGDPRRDGTGLTAEMAPTPSPAPGEALLPPDPGERP